MRTAPRGLRGLSGPPVSRYLMNVATDTRGYRIWYGYKGLEPHATGGDAPIDTLFAWERQTSYDTFHIQRIIGSTGGYPRSCPSGNAAATTNGAVRHRRVVSVRTG